MVRPSGTRAQEQAYPDLRERASAAGQGGIEGLRCEADDSFYLLRVKPLEPPHDIVNIGSRLRFSKSRSRASAFLPPSDAGTIAGCPFYTHEGVSAGG